jgi:hypothetical protein
MANILTLSVAKGKTRKPYAAYEARFPTSVQKVLGIRFELRVKPRPPAVLR